jgi:hypothetical protein
MITLFKCKIYRNADTIADKAKRYTIQLTMYKVTKHNMVASIKGSKVPVAKHVEGLVNILTK